MSSVFNQHGSIIRNNNSFGNSINYIVTDGDTFET